MAAAREYAESCVTATAAEAVLFTELVVGVVPPRLAPGPCSPMAERLAVPPCQKKKFFLSLPSETRRDAAEKRRKNARKQRRKKGSKMKTH